ncbi:MAG: universal stress protein [Planctomycetales bacterium]|nr:universal stress protein [Planctomycetales bacterium]
MNIRNILCPVDFSDSSKTALTFASALAREHDAELHIVYSYEEPFAYTEGAFPGYVPPADLAPDHTALNAMLPEGTGIRFRHNFLFGAPARTLLDYASEHDIDIIVMGTHGRTGLSRLLMGSVAEEVVRHAECPVVTVKTPAEASEAASDDGSSSTAANTH